MITITNGILTARLNEFGAELKSLSDGKTEYIWPGDEKFWASSCPVLFPICSGLKNGTYTLAGREYRMEKHGFADKTVFSAERLTQDSVTFLLCDNATTLAQFPYHFALRITYTLQGKKLTVRYDVRNRDGAEMYFSIGAHEGYFCPEGIEDYEILLPEKQTLRNALLTESGALSGETEVISAEIEALPLSYQYFANDTLIFTDFKGSSVVLHHRKTNQSVRVVFNGFPYLLIWTKPDAPYICLEPWCGLPDRDDTNGALETKLGIEHIAAGEIFVREHTIEIL